MKNKIITIIIGLSFITGAFPASVFAQWDTSNYDFSSPSVSSYDYTSPAVSSYNYTSPTVSSYDYTSPTVSSYNYTSPTVSSYNYTSPTVSSYNYTSPTVSSYNYTSPTVSSYDYTSPTVSSYNYTSSTVSSYNYTSPTISSYDYTSPTVSSYNYTSPTVSGYNYTSPTVSSYNYTSPTVSSYDYTSPYNYTSPSYSTPAYTAPSYSTPVYSTPTYTTPTYTTPTYTTPTYTTPIYTTPTYNYPPVTNVYTNPPAPIIYTPPVVVPPAVTYQTCWNGSVIPTTQACPAQYQTCWNGSVIPVGQACPINYPAPVYNYPTPVVPPIIYSQPTYVTPIVYTPPVYIPQRVYNNVITSIPTQITNTSARCNGIGIIANNAPSTGWFEYGETPALGRTTQSANIGSYHTSPFSNVLANLKPHTTYYCRAGMSNSYGTFRGEIVRFTTKSKYVAYVKPVHVTYKKTVVKKKVDICINEAGTLADGQKAVTLLLETTNGNLALNGNVTYTLSYKNISSSNLRDVVIKIVLPQELAFTSVTTGSYDEMTRTVTVNLGTLGALSEGKISVNANVSDKSQIGKTVITTGYIVYTLGESSSVAPVQDEITTYILGTIMPSVEKTDLGAKKVIGGDNGVSFLPNSLIEWVALLAIIFILIVLGRSIYTSYREDRKKH